MEGISWPAVNFIWAAIVTLATAASVIYTWWHRHNAANKDALTETSERLGTRIKGLEERATVLEQTAKFAPSAEDLAELRREMKHLSNNIARFEGAQEAQNRILSLIHEHLMQRGA